MDRRKFLKKFVGDGIFFAGEATSDQFQTFHGADIIGEHVTSDVAFGQKNYS